MTRKQFATSMLLSLLLTTACGSNESVPDRGRTVQRPGLCKVYPTNVAQIQGTIGPPPKIGDLGNDNLPLQLCAAKKSQPCLCDDHRQPNSTYTQYPAPPEISTIPADAGCLNGCTGGLNGCTGGVEDGLTTGVFRSEVTRTCNDQGFPNPCVQGQPICGCTNSYVNGEVIFAWPDCATIAQVSGTVYESGGFNPDGTWDPGNDDDFTFNICPDTNSMWV